VCKAQSVSLRLTASETCARGTNGSSARAQGVPVRGWGGSEADRLVGAGGLGGADHLSVLVLLLSSDGQAMLPRPVSAPPRARRVSLALALALASRPALGSCCCPLVPLACPLA
jgi:hypothetical protein